MTFSLCSITFSPWAEVCLYWWDSIISHFCFQWNYTKPNVIAKSGSYPQVLEQGSNELKAIWGSPLRKISTPKEKSCPEENKSTWGSMAKDGDIWAHTNARHLLCWGRDCSPCTPTVEAGQKQPDRLKSLEPGSNLSCSRLFFTNGLWFLKGRCSKCTYLDKGCQIMTRQTW